LIQLSICEATPAPRALKGLALALSGKSIEIFRSSRNPLADRTLMW